MAVTTRIEPTERAFRRQRLLLTALLFFGYIGYYFGRVTLPVALPVIGDLFASSSAETGLILSVYYAVYAAAKLANGFLGDRIGGKVLLLVGIFGSAAMNAVFGFGEELLFFVLVWGANAWFQSMGWLAIVPIMASWYPSRESGRVMGVMSLSYQLGDFAARSVAALLIVALGWSGLFLAHAALLALVGTALFALVQPKPAGALPVAAGGGPVPEPGDRAAGTRARRSRMLRNRAFWIVCASYLLLSIIRYSFWGWSVEYLVSAGAGIGTAALTSAVFPLLGSAGSIVAGWVSDRMGARRGPVLVVMCLLLTGSIVGFSRLPADSGLWLPATLGLVGFSLYGPYSLMAGAVAMDFGGQQASASAAGIIDMIGSVGAIVTGVGMGYLVDTLGWDSAFAVIIALAAAASALSLLLWNLRPLRGS